MRLDAGQIEAIDDVMVGVLRGKSHQERLEIADGMWRSTRNLLLFSLRSRFSDWDEARLEHEVARRMSHGAV